LTAASARDPSSACNALAHHVLPVRPQITNGDVTDDGMPLHALLRHDFWWGSKLGLVGAAARRPATCACRVPPRAIHPQPLRGSWCRGQAITSPSSHKSYRPITVLAFRLTRRAWMRLVRQLPWIERAVPQFTDASGGEDSSNHQRATESGAAPAGAPGRRRHACTLTRSRSSPQACLGWRSRELSMRPMPHCMQAL